MGGHIKVSIEEGGGVSYKSLNISKKGGGSYNSLLVSTWSIEISIVKKQQINDTVVCIEPFISIKQNINNTIELYHS